MRSDDTNSLRHLPRRSSKNCDTQFDNFDRFNENYIIDDTATRVSAVIVEQHDQSDRPQLRQVAPYVTNNRDVRDHSKRPQ